MFSALRCLPRTACLSRFGLAIWLLSLTSVPLQAASLAAGDGHTLVVEPQGRVVGLGRNEAGQLGNGSTEPIATRVFAQLPADVSIAEVAAGAGFSLALATDGVLWSWGKNSLGQLGSGDTTDRSVPQPVQFPAGITVAGMAAGSAAAAALGSDGLLYAWGKNSYGFLGSNTSEFRTTPVAIPLPAGLSATAVAVGGEHGLLLDSLGRVHQWGHDFNEYLGLPSSGNLLRPTLIALPEKIQAIAAGDRHAVALGESGQVYAWGSDDAGQRGDGSSGGTELISRVPLPAGSKAVMIAAGSLHTLAQTSDGRFYAWGDNDYAQFGNGQARYLASNGINSTAVQAASPQEVPLPAGLAFTQLAAGRHSVARTADGLLYTWGSNFGGELGYSTSPEFLGLVPRQVSTVEVAGPRWAGVTLNRISTCLFDWLESKHANLLGHSNGNQFLPPYTFRHYPGTDAYVGVSRDSQRLYYLGMASAGSLADLGPLPQWQGESSCR